MKNIYEPLIVGAPSDLHKAIRLPLEGDMIKVYATSISQIRLLKQIQCD